MSPRKTGNGKFEKEMMNDFGFSVRRFHQNPAGGVLLALWGPGDSDFALTLRLITGEFVLWHCYMSFQQIWGDVHSHMIKESN